MSELEWQPLPSPMWPDPAVFTDVGDFTLLVFTQDGVPTWEVRRRATLGSGRDDLLADGNAEALLFGQPHFFTPRPVSPFLLPRAAPQQVSFYDTTPMLFTLRRLRTSR